MSEFYTLMHKDVFCGVLSIDHEGALVGYKADGSLDAPFVGNADFDLMKRWWEARAIPASRNAIKEILRNAGCHSSKEYLAKNLALSFTDCYWIKPLELNLGWKDVNLYSNCLSEKQIVYKNTSTYDPNASLGGQMDKYWDTTANVPILVKTAYQAYGQQAVNEIFATMVHERQKPDVPYCRYWIKPAADNGILVCCNAFTSEKVEYIPAMEVIDSGKKKNESSIYDSYIEICAANGLDESTTREALDYQTLTDFIISNTDEHLMNFGILRDADTLKWISTAPIFDSGNSMFYSENRTVPYTRTELLERKITGFFDAEEKLLKRVKAQNVIHLDLLPTPSETKDFYRANGIPEPKAAFIAGSYEQKLRLLEDFINGKTISLYNEKRKKT